MERGELAVVARIVDDLQPAYISYNLHVARIGRHQWA
jgi:hypothetical protein